MNLSEWRASQKIDKPITLPSGLEIQIKKVRVYDLLLEGHIPLTLSALVQEASAGFGVDDVPRYMPLIDAVTRAAVVSPVIVEKPDDMDESHIAFREFSATDKLHIFNEVNAGANALQTFHEESETALEAVSGGNGVSPTPKRARRNRKR